ncbi:TrmH family RNA methyltransferase [Candidatus Saccharibacteria bacterium]|nr:MAG: TrmH family RNA methyltransferase [Candidatus Saccharibacteria bacterium]
MKHEKQVQRKIVLIVHDIRSTHNVGSLLRTADCLGVDEVYLTGYTPYPKHEHDERLPHISAKLTSQIHKTALGAETFVRWKHSTSVTFTISKLRRAGYSVVALEQTAESTSILSWMPSDKIAILLGREVEGIDPSLLKLCEYAVQIPNLGQKESLNVVQAAAIALYQARFAVSQ